MDGTGTWKKWNWNGEIPFYADTLNIINEYFPLRNRVCFFFFYVVLKTFSINA